MVLANSPVGLGFLKVSKKRYTPTKSASQNTLPQNDFQHPPNFHFEDWWENVLKATEYALVMGMNLIFPVLSSMSSSLAYETNFEHHQPSGQVKPVKDYHI